MILLSALLASLTGLVSGERPAERAQVELSVVAAIAQTGKAAAQAADHPRVVQPVLRREARTPSPAMAAPVLAPRALLSLKQSWLH